MTDEPREELTDEELEDENAELLPDREEMMSIRVPFEPIGGGGFTLPIEPPATE
jgi:hypothetical protein